MPPDGALSAPTFARLSQEPCAASPVGQPQAAQVGTAAVCAADAAGQVCGDEAPTDSDEALTFGCSVLELLVFYQK